MTIIHKKCWKEYFEKVVSGQKKAELRLNDFDISEGDILILDEWDNETREYTGRSIEKKITCVTKIPLENLEKFW
ncbi:MAG: DUF3850 domain-containing protein, partial [Candidatus Nomurabacteria bacterium]